jgi:O-antigen ligase
MVPGLALHGEVLETIAQPMTAMLGTVCVGLILINKLVDLDYIAYAMLGASIANVIAIQFGIETSQLHYGVTKLTRYSGMLGNSNVLAINFSLTAIVIWLFSKKIVLPVKILSIATAFYGIYVSGSRQGVILGVVILLIVFKQMTSNFSRLKQVAFLITLSIILIFFYHYFGDVLYLLNRNVLAFNRLTQMFDGQESSFSERKYLISLGYKIWRQSPLVGEGLGQFAATSGFGKYSHNNYIEILVSGGVIALLLYYSIYTQIIYYAFKSQRNEITYSLLIVITMLLLDTAAVNFVSRSFMLFTAVALAHYSPKGYQPNLKMMRKSLFVS